MAKLTGLQTLLERLLLRLVLRGLCCQCGLQVLLCANVEQPCLLHACAKALQGGLVGEHSARLLLGKRLLTGSLIQTDALRCGLQQQVVFFLHLRRHGSVKRLATRSQALVNQLRVELLALALQLRGEARHNRLLCRRASVNRPLCDALNVNLTLQLWPLHKALCGTKLTLLGATRHTADARGVQTAKLQPTGAA